MTSHVTSARGGCERCPQRWDGKNALALAARHHDLTQHPTWAEVTQRTEYGQGKVDTSTQSSML